MINIATQAEVVAGDLTGVAPLLFFSLAAMAGVGAIGVVLSHQIIRMAVWLLVTLTAVALLYFFLQAEFIAAIQLIVYVGGTLILILFGIMLTGKSPSLRFEVPWYERALGWLVGLVGMVILSVLGLQLASELVGTVDESTAEGSVDTLFSVNTLGEQLLTKYMLPFELAAVILLVVMIGAAYIAKGRREETMSEGGESS